MENKEIRSGEAQVVGESRTVEGYAVRFNSESNYLGFYETILPSAITEDTINNSDIYARLDHQETSVLARSNKGVGSLKLEVREDGVFYTFEAPNTNAGNELLEHLKRGEINSSSFAFTVAQEEGAEKWYRDSNNNLKRNIYKIDRLFDVSPVFSPAYNSTSCSLRGEQVKAQVEEVDKAFKVYEDEINNL